MRRWLCFAGLVLTVPLFVAGQTLLPSRFGGWQAAAGGTSAALAPESSPGDQALFRSCHQQSVESRVYRRNGATITVTLRRLGDPSYAYSAYSILRPVPATDVRPTAHASIGKDQAMFLVGNLFVDISGQNLAGDARDFRALAASLKPHASNAPYPTLWQYLPTVHIIPHSDRYALDAQTFERVLAEEGTGGWPTGKWVGFESDDAEAEVARYDLGGKPATLVLLSYPTPQLAAEHVRDLKKWAAAQAGAATSGGSPGLYAKRVGSLMGVVSGAPAPAADNLLKQIRYQTIVTWNEPGFKLHELSMGDYVVGSIFGTFALLVIAFVVGIALGMVRISVKHFMPGIVFDRRRSVEIIQLGLSSKPINARDFY